MKTNEDKKKFVVVIIFSFLLVNIVAGCIFASGNVDVFSEGSILFADNNGDILDDPNNFTWDIISKTLYVNGVIITPCGNSSEWCVGDGNVTTFLNLTDTPNSYNTHALKIVRVKNDETGLEFYLLTDNINDTVNGTELDALLFGSNGLLRKTGINSFDTIIDNSSNWNLGYSWGDHSLAGYDITNDSWVMNNGEVYTLDNVGIGTNNPNCPFHVVGNSYISAYLGLGNQTSPSWHLDAKTDNGPCFTRMQASDGTSSAGHKITAAGIEWYMSITQQGHFIFRRQTAPPSSIFYLHKDAPQYAFKAWNTGIIFNEGGNNYDFRVESDNNENMFFVDGGNDRVGIGTNNPSSILEVEGTTMMEILQLNKLTSAPGSPTDGMVIYADGTSWNPGSGEGIYAYYNAGWHYLG